jgi:hypothetical protein
MLETGTSGVPMTIGAILHHLEASDIEVTFDMISHHAEGPLLNPSRPPLQLA